MAHGVHLMGRSAKYHRPRGPHCRRQREPTPHPVSMTGTGAPIRTRGQW
ncbi:MAG: hypothetical protein R3C97_11835 [Geminicoccaceae bacterium]